MADRYDLVTVHESGQEGKKRYTNIGTMWPSKKGEGFTIKLNALPLPNEKGEVWISCFVPKPRDDSPRQVTHRDAMAPGPDDGIPF